MEIFTSLLEYYRSIIPVTRRLRQEDHKYKAILGYIVSSNHPGKPRLKINKEKEPDVSFSICVLALHA